MITHEYEKINFSTKDIPSDFRHYFSENWGEVKATQFCGALKIGDETLTILPKIDKIRPLLEEYFYGEDVDAIFGDFCVKIL